MPVSSQESDLPIRMRWSLAVFGAALLFHFYFVTINWSYGFMQGHEFRQAQTALITEYINKQNNFGIDYETPILGKPWAFPLEFPFYQWTVVMVKRIFDVEFFEAARAVSLACFYGALPAVFLLLGSWQISRAKRWLMLALILVSPVYIFYSRAFLIDPMAMMFSAWFLTAFVRAMQQRSWAWWGVATLVGTLGILVKILVFVVWLFPAALFGAWIVWQELRAKVGARALLKTVGFGVGAVVLPYVAITWWIGHTDAIKAVHRSAWIFTSTALTQGNFGTFSLESRLAAETWSTLAVRWSETIAPAGFLLSFLGLGILLCPKNRRYIIGAFLIWMFGQLAFPYAYAYQDYYFYAGAIFAVLALGFVVVGLLEELRASRVARLCLAAIPFVVLGHTYLKGYYAFQSVKSNGGSGMTALFRDMLPSDSIIVGVGQDWSAIVPYYSKRKALMVRSGLAYDGDYMAGAVEDLDGTSIGALMITGDQRFDKELVESLTRITGVVPSPLFRHRETEVFVNPIIYSDLHYRLGPGGSKYPGVEPLDQPEGVDFSLAAFNLARETAESVFTMIDPLPHRMRIRYGYNPAGYGEHRIINYHPDSDLWIEPSNSVGSFRWRYGLLDAAWERDGDRSDGVDFLVFVETPTGDRREIFRDEVTPDTNETKRGILVGEFDYDIGPEDVLVFSCRARGNAAYDWAFLLDIAEQ